MRKDNHTTDTHSLETFPILTIVNERRTGLELNQTTSKVKQWNDWENQL